MNEEGNPHRLNYKNTNKNAEEMRRRRVEDKVQLRKNKREETLLKKRSMLSEGKDIDSEPIDTTVSEDGVPMNLDTIKELAFSDNPEVRLHVVQSARKLLSGNKKPPIDELIKGGILPSLVACLSSEDPNLQFEAAWALTNIASGNSQQTNAVVNSGAVPHFLELLSSPNLHVCEQCVWALGNIIGDGPKFRDYLIELGVIPPLLKLLSQRISISFQRNITWVMVNLCRNKDPSPPQEAIRQLLPALLYLIKHTDHSILVDTVWAISYLSDGGPTQIDMVIEAEIVPHLVPLLSHSHFKVQTAALRALGNIVTGSDVQTQKVLDAGALSHFDGLLKHDRPKMHKEAVWFLSNIAAGNQDQIQELINQGLVPLIVQHLSVSDFHVQKEAAWAISNMIINGSPRQLHYLINQGIVAPMCKMLTVRDVQILQIVLDGLLNLLRNVDLMRPEVIEQIERCNGLDYIEELQENQNQEVYSFAYQIICQYFSAQSPDSNSVVAEHGTDIVRLDPNEDFPHSANPPVGALGDHSGQQLPGVFQFVPPQQPQQPGATPQETQRNYDF